MIPVSLDNQYPVQSASKSNFRTKRYPEIVIGSVVEVNLIAGFNA